MGDPSLAYTQPCNASQETQPSCQLPDLVGAWQGLLAELGLATQAPGEYIAKWRTG